MNQPKYALVMFDEQNRVVFQAENVVQPEITSGDGISMGMKVTLLLGDEKTDTYYRMKVYEEITA